MSNNTKDAKKKASAKANAKNAVKKNNNSKTEAVDKNVATNKSDNVKNPKKPTNNNKFVIVLILSVFTVCMGAISGYILSKACLAKSESIFISKVSNLAVATANGYDISLARSIYNQNFLYVVLVIIGIAFVISIYGGKKRILYLMEFALVNAASMLVMNYLFLPAISGFEIYYALYSTYFWFILCGTICGFILFDIFILTFSVLRFRRLEKKGKVNENGMYYSNLPADNEVFDETQDTIEIVTPINHNKLKTKKT